VQFSGPIYNNKRYRQGITLSESQIRMSVLTKVQRAICTHPILERAFRYFSGFKLSPSDYDTLWVCFDVVYKEVDLGDLAMGTELEMLHRRLPYNMQ
ncbi:hypothetical protein CRM22_006473, partial [Opisthorchis felineus]